ncbi:MAG: response regulator [Saonia sp.]
MLVNSFKLRTILLVGNDHAANFLNRIFIRHLELDIKVDIVLNGKEAIDFIYSSSFMGPCLLILDSKMPVMDGWEFLDAYDKVFRKETKDQIIIVMIASGKDNLAMLKAKKNPYVAEYLQKPLFEKKFKELIKKYF